MIISVTEEHIEAGKRGSPSFCPVALAVQEELKDDTIVVGFLGIHQKGKFSPFGHEVRKFIHKFDEKKEVKPFTFDF